MKTDNITIRRATLKDLKTIQRFGYELLDYERRNWDPALDVNWPFSKEGEQKYLTAITDKYTIIAEKDKTILAMQKAMDEMQQALEKKLAEQ